MHISPDAKPGLAVHPHGMAAHTAMRRGALAELRIASAASPTATATVDRKFAALVDVPRAAQTVCDRTREQTGPPLVQLTLA